MGRQQRRPGARRQRRPGLLHRGDAKQRSRDLVGRRVREVFPGIEAIGLLNLFQQVYRTGQSASHQSNLQECEQTVARLLRLLAKPYRIDGEELKLSASIGVTRYPLDKSDSDTLLRHADHAMYIAKQRGRNDFHVFDPDADDPLIAKLGLTLRIGEALENGELRLLYQPIVDMRTGRVDSMEALVRWQHPERGLLPPRDFLPLIEDGDLILQLDMWVLAHALGDLAGWIERGLSLTLFVNISYHSLIGAGFVERVKGMLDAHPSLRADQIGLEILETAALTTWNKSPRSFAKAAIWVCDSPWTTSAPANRP